MFGTRRVLPLAKICALPSSAQLLTRGFAQHSGCRMTLHRLAVRTKKSLSGLYSPNKEKDSIPASPSYVHSCLFQRRLTEDRSINPRETASKLIITPPKTECSTLGEFGLLRSDDDMSPSGNGSPSRRHRILGSLRSMRSLRTLRATQSNFKKSEEESAGSDYPQTPVSNNRMQPV